MMARRVVFWDFDGTLAERDGMWPEIVRDAVLAVEPLSEVGAGSLAAGLERGFPDWGPGELRVYPDATAWWSAASPTLISACLSAGIDPRTAERAVAEVPRIYYRPSTWRLLPGAFDALERTSRAGLANVILSNHAPELPVLVEALGFGPLVELTVTSASLGAEKPNPIVFQTALRLADASPDSWMIGDNPIADVEGARAVGLRALLVHRSATNEPPLTLTDAADTVVRECHQDR